MSDPILTSAIVRRMVGVGRRVDQDKALGEEVFGWLRRHAGLSRLHFEQWVSAADELSLPDQVALLRALTVAVRDANWERGSVSPVVWVFHAFARRAPYSVALDLARWIVSQVEGYYLPLGGVRLWRAFERISSEPPPGPRQTLMDHLSSVDAKEALERAKSRRADEEEADRVRARREADRAEVRRQHFDRKARKDAQRKRLLLEATSLDDLERLEIVARRTDFPLGMFPGRWAAVTDADLARLVPDVRVLLVQRLKGVRLLPWRGLARRLMAS